MKKDEEIRREFFTALKKVTQEMNSFDRNLELTVILFRFSISGQQRRLPPCCQRGQGKMLQMNICCETTSRPPMKTTETNH